MIQGGARELGVNVKTPDINLSIEDFSVANGEILFGLSAIRNVGDVTAEKIVAERESGNYETVQDFLARTDSRSLNKRGVEAMIQGGAWELGVNVKTPDINLSIEDFSVANGEILFGLSAIRNVGDVTAEKIVAERESGNYETVQDFLARTDSRSLNKRGVEAMIQGGARELGVNVKTPDINLSIEDFSVANGEILFGLSAIRNVGDVTAEKIVAERESGNYETVQDFLARTDSRSLNKRGVEAMIQGGAFDQFGFPRRGLYESIIDLIEDAKGLKKEKDNSQASLFDLDEQTNELTTIKNVEWEKKELLDREREMLGFFVSEDPLEGYGEIFRSESTHSIIELMDIEEDEEVNVAITGLVSNVQKRVSRRGNAWIQFDLQEHPGNQ
jgi:DNA polymerase III alpha subunit